MRRLFSPRWWTVSHTVLAVTVIVVLRALKGAEVATAEALGWTATATVLLAVVTAILGLMTALICRWLVRSRSGLLRTSRYAATLILLLAGAVMVIQA
jgi:hypothetical protein